MIRVPLGLFTRRILLSALFLATASLGAYSQTLKADYRFQGNLDSSIAGAPAMTHLTGAGGANSFAGDKIDGYSRQSLRFPLDSGVAVNTSGVIPSDTYTIVILFKMDDLSGYRRVLDTKNGTSDDCGAYIFESRFDTEPNVNTNSILFPNLYTQATIVREASGRIRAYRDGRLKVDVANDGGCFQISNNVLRFFQDDSEVPGESSAGNVARIRLYDAPMTVEQINTLGRVENANGGGDQRVIFNSDRDGNYEVYSMNADGSNQVRLTNNMAYDGYPGWSAVRQKIIFATNRDGNYEIYTMNADGSQQTRITNNPGTDYRPQWSPDGTKIVFSKCDPVSGICDIWKMDPDGGNQVALATHSGDDDYAKWSPDGSKIIFASQRDHQSHEIYTMNPDGTNVIRLTNNTVTDMLPEYSPDGTKVVYQNYLDSQRSEIYTMNANGSGLFRITNDPFENTNPTWNGDGTKILYTSWEGTATLTSEAGNDIRLINPDGSGNTRLTADNRYDWVGAWRNDAAVPVTQTPFDFDGDGKTDVGIYRPNGGSGGEWWYLRSSDGGNRVFGLGSATDKIVPVDFTGDGKTDLGFWRPSTGYWYVMRSEDNTFYGFPFGAEGDVPVPGDYDADGKADAAVFRSGSWYILLSSSGATRVDALGTAGDRPVTADYDGDGKSDVAIYRPAGGSGAGEWWINMSTAGLRAVAFGSATDNAVPGDYTGDGKADIAIWRPSTGFWYVIRSEDFSFYGFPFGADGDVPAPGDYDGDGRFDAAVFRNGTWYINRSTAGQQVVGFGAAGDKPVASAFVR